jgi:hypothetical protein
LREIRIELPPVQPDLFRFINGANQQPDADRQQFNIRQRHTYVSGDDQTLIEYSVKDVEQIGGSTCSGYTFHWFSFFFAGLAKLWVTVPILRFTAERTDVTPR